MVTKNYKSDFDFILKLYSALTDSSGKETEREELPWPDYDWTATLWTQSKANAYVASCIGGKCSNCYNDNGQIHIVVDDHHMGPGRLKVEFRAELPREIYPDGYQRNVIPEPLDIELVAGKGDLPSEMEAELFLPYIKGDKGDAFTYADFTAEQIAGLQKPATDAATEAKATEKSVKDAEALRIVAENNRISSEQIRQTREQERFNAENSRQQYESERGRSEQIRVSNEDDRVLAENARVAAEQNRATEFAGYSDAIEEAKHKVFDDLWRAAVGDYGSINHTHVEGGVTKPYYLNKLWLTYEEAVATMIYGNHLMGSQAFSYNNTTFIRTNLPPLDVIDGQTCPCKMMFLGQRKLEVAIVTAVSNGAIWLTPDSYAMFGSCPKLHTVIGIINMVVVSSADKYNTPFHNCPALENVKISGLKTSLFLGSCAAISLESLSYLVANAVNTSAITITVHPDIYARLTDENNTEWHQVLLDATEKNIIFATPT